MPKDLRAQVGGVPAYPAQHIEICEYRSNRLYLVTGLYPDLEAAM